MWIIVLIAFLLITYWIGFCQDEDFADTLPVTLSGLVILLFVLAILRHMDLIGLVGIVTLVIALAAAILMGKTGRKELVTSVRGFFINPKALVVMLGLMGLGLLTKDHIATWWDDVNFWATDAKALYFLGGFPGKYGNVAPEFGDYPPALQIIKWCFAKMNGSEYKEGLGFAGYYIANVIFGLPLVSVTKKKGLGYQIGAFVLVFLLPGICNDVWSLGACADVTMGIVYGALLIAIIDYKGHSKLFYYVRIGLFMSVLTLIKSVGFEWAIYAAIFFIIHTVIVSRGDEEVMAKKDRVLALIPVIAGFLCQIAWWLLCLINRRIAKLTSSGAHMATGGYRLPDNAGHKAGLFFKGWLTCPMHTDKTWLIDLSAAGMLAVLFAVIIVLALIKKLSKQERFLLLIYTFITGVCAYGIVLLGHVTIFAGETQYETPEIMAISISRYAAPFTIGMLMLLLYIIATRVDDIKVHLAICAFVLLTTDYVAAYSALVGYRSTLDEDAAGRAAMVDDAGRRYADKVAEDKRLWGHRVLYLRDDTTIHWVKDTYINYEVAPVPTVYAGINPSTMSAEDIANAIRLSHAEYIYIEDVAHLENEVSTSDLMKPYLPEEDEFRYETVYHISDANGVIRISE